MPFLGKRVVNWKGGREEGREGGREEERREKGRGRERVEEMERNDMKIES